MKYEDRYAFPGQDYLGMTLFEYYVGQAMKGLLSDHRNIIACRNEKETLAKQAIEQADAIMKILDT